MKQATHIFPDNGNTEIEVKRLDDLNNLPKVDYIKIDETFMS